ncbi:hypothetical protein OR1_02644 [Geobacter sp. OR-1]|uniref:hypothetical protein n=1 Tax=Geobacter sp. OR-1 TaxID=1266765 RepID=UPI000543F648|nr:hypothetical protein [Geobacter sp. OR-1]GAM10355.1 hypothetical protein OR1_02644 [Geobacter sp. OR-1]
MKKRYVPILTFTVALLLVGSIAYAADKRKKAKSLEDDLNALSEDDTLQVELLASVDDRHKPVTDTKVEKPIDAEKLSSDLGISASENKYIQ